MNKVHAIYRSVGITGPARPVVYNGLQMCGTGMGNRNTRRIGTELFERVTCGRCFVILGREVGRMFR